MVASMNLNPEFQKGFRGYRVDEVDEFVNEVSGAYEQIRRELLAARDENQKLIKQLEYFQSLEGSLNKALLAAQQKADEIIHNAQEEVTRSLVESRERLANINDEIAQILAGAAEKSREIEEEATRRAEEIIQKAEQRAAEEVNRLSATEQKIAQDKQELIQILKRFLGELEEVVDNEPELGENPEASAQGESEGIINW